MKKFLACVFILAVFTGAVFYVGWTQFRVKPDTIGIVVSKTSGVDEKPVLNGEFAWHWQFLLPTNATLKTFHIKPYSTQKTISGTLPSGEAYASIYNAQGLEPNLLTGVIYAIATSIGFALALIIFAGIREQLARVRVPKSMEGMAIALITAGLLALAFMGFSGVDHGIAVAAGL